MRIDRILEDALEKYPPRIYPTHVIGVSASNLSSVLKEKTFEAAGAARKAAILAFAFKIKFLRSTYEI